MLLVRVSWWTSMPKSATTGEMKLVRLTPMTLVVKLVRMQQAMGESKGIVMDGRDIGTVVFPNAEMKVFCDASAERRAERRYKELLGKGAEVTYEEVLENVRTRDHIDETRSEGPLRCAADAVRLDNSAMTIEEQNAWLLGLYRERTAQSDR